MPADGLPVASMTMSICGAAITRCGVVGRRCVVRVAAPLRERRRTDALRRPAGRAQRGARAIRREVGDRDDVDARRRARLRQVHRAELAGADERDAQRLAFVLALLQQMVQVHA